MCQESWFLILWIIGIKQWKYMVFSSDFHLTPTLFGLVIQWPLVFLEFLSFVNLWRSPHPLLEPGWRVRRCESWCIFLCGAQWRTVSYVSYYAQTCQVILRKGYHEDESVWKLISNFSSHWPPWRYPRSSHKTSKGCATHPCGQEQVHGDDVLEPSAPSAIREGRGDVGIWKVCGRWPLDPYTDSLMNEATIQKIIFIPSSERCHHFPRFRTYCNHVMPHF